MASQKTCRVRLGNRSSSQAKRQISYLGAVATESPGVATRGFDCWRTPWLTGDASERVLVSNKWGMT